MKCFSSLVGGLVLFPRSLQPQSPLWTGDWEPELSAKQEENKSTVDGEDVSGNPASAMSFFLYYSD